MAIAKLKIWVGVVLVIFFLMHVQSANAWWDTNWKNSYSISITHNNGTHINEPIFLNVSNISCKNTNKADLRIVYQNSSVLDYQWWWPGGQTANDTVVFLANSTDSDNTNYFAYCNNTAATSDSSIIIFDAIDTFTRANSGTIGNLEWPLGKSWEESDG